MTTERRLADGIVAALASLQIPIELQEVQLVRPVRPEHGDWSTNAALVVAKSAGRAPREVAGDLARRSTCGLGNHKRCVGRPVAVLGAHRSNELNLLQLDWDLKGCESRDNPVGQASFCGHWSLRMAEVPLACNTRSTKPS